MFVFVLILRILEPYNRKVCEMFRICKKLASFLRKLQTLRANNSRILTIKNAKFSGYYFYINLNIWREFQICISGHLKHISYD